MHADSIPSPDATAGPAYSDHLAATSARYEEALAIAGFDALIIDAGESRPWFLDDIAGDWKVNPHFRIFTPAAPCEGCSLVLSPGGRPTLLHLQPRDYWHLPPSAPEGTWTQHFEIRTVRTAEERETVIGELAAGFNGPIARIGPDSTIFEDNPAALLARLDHGRARKTPWELGCMRGASVLAARGHDAARAAFRDGASEFQIHLAYLAACGLEDAELPYRNIVALDTHGAVLHYQHRDRDLPSSGGASLLIDAGADHLGYAADVTRTWVKQPGEFADLVTAMDALQRTLLSEIRAGADWVDLHLRTHELLAELLIQAEIAHASVEALVAEDVTRTFLPHGLGHLIGLQTHDAGGQLADPDGSIQQPPSRDPALRLTRTLAEDWTVTVEPGLYFIPMLLDELRASRARNCVDWQRVAALTPFGGIRIEDNVRVTNSGIENLTRDAFDAIGTTSTGVIA